MNSAYFIQQIRLILFFCVFTASGVFIVNGLLGLIQGFKPAWAGEISLDTEQEKYWRELLSKNIKTGQIIDLKTSQQTFLAIYKKQDLLIEQGSVVLLHDKAEHPDWKDVIRPLRTQLPKHGWNTLSIQMPLRKSTLKTEEELQAFYQQGYPRLDTAIRYLKDQHVQAIFLIAYGSNSQVVVNYLKLNPNRDVRGIVLISAVMQNSINLLEDIKLPVLDIYGSSDFASVNKTAPQRLNAAKRGGNRNYAQRKINFADHFFAAESEILVKLIHSWMISIIRK